MRLFAFLIEEHLKDERGSDGIDFILFLGSGCLHCLERIFGGDRRESLVLSSDFDIGCNGFEPLQEGFCALNRRALGAI